MDDDREAFEFAYALYLARQVDREAAQMIVEAAEAGQITLRRGDGGTVQITESRNPGGMNRVIRQMRWLSHSENGPLAGPVHG